MTRLSPLEAFLSCLIDWARSMAAGQRASAADNVARGTAQIHLDCAVLVPRNLQRHPESDVHRRCQGVAMEKEDGRDFLNSLLNKNLRIVAVDGRMFLGQFKCTDPVILPVLLVRDCIADT